MKTGLTLWSALPRRAARQARHARCRVCAVGPVPTSVPAVNAVSRSHLNRRHALALIPSGNCVVHAPASCALPPPPSGRASRAVPLLAPLPTACSASRPSLGGEAPFAMHPWMPSKGELLETVAPGAYAHYRRPPWALCRGAPHPAPLHRPLSTPPPPQAPLHLPRLLAHLLCRPGCWNRSTGRPKIHGTADHRLWPLLLPNRPSESKPR
jgi:hypothetical protein